MRDETVWREEELAEKEDRASEARGVLLPDIGPNADVDTAVFAMTPGGVTDAITTSTGAVIARVAERTDVTDAQIAEGRDALRDRDRRTGGRAGRPARLVLTKPVVRLFRSYPVA